jgi:hypothetical protein
MERREKESHESRELRESQEHEILASWNRSLSELLSLSAFIRVLRSSSVLSVLSSRFF